MDNIKKQYKIMEEIIVRVLDFAENPGPRYRYQGNYSGEEFYIKVLNQKMAECIQADHLMIVHLDGTSGYPSSFLDQAFGELVYDFGQDLVRTYVHFITVVNKRRVLKLENETYPQWHQKRGSEIIKHEPIVRDLFYFDSVSKTIKKRDR